MALTLVVTRLPAFPDVVWRSPLLLVLVVLVVTPSVSRAEPDRAGQIREYSSVSDSFRAELRRGESSIPTAIWLVLRRRGWRVGAAEFVVDAAPTLKFEHPRGWPRGTTWEQTDAVHLPNRRLLVVAEKRRTQKGKVVPGRRPGGVLRHEIGHAVDQAMSAPGFCSSSGAFRRAYQADVRKLSNSDAAALRYYLQRSAAGRQEAFAEAFGILLGGGSDTPHRAAFERGFPRVLASVRASLVSWDAAPPAAANDPVAE